MGSKFQYLGLTISPIMLKFLSAYLFFLPVACLVLLSCDKKAGAYNPDFIGTWRTPAIAVGGSYGNVRNEIIIEENDGAYNYYCQDTCDTQLCNCITQQNGKPVVNSDKSMLRIGSANSTPLSIDEEPYLDSVGVWTMKIGGFVYKKD